MIVSDHLWLIVFLLVNKFKLLTYWIYNEFFINVTADQIAGILKQMKIAYIFLLFLFLLFVFWLDKLFWKIYGEFLDDVDEKHRIVKVNIVSEIDLRIYPQNKQHYFYPLCPWVANILGVKFRDEKLGGVC